ncbi:MAG TPA: R2-like ligand-binding oxidase [Candidatus Dormibacteraeota bacterium]|nr:R2-like ligand-binding oxidase [Candidatus Dormibacteraeota bacterium]
MSATRSGYATTSERGLRWDSVPMRLWQKAKRLGVWDPAEIDFERDREHWAGFSPPEREFLLRTLALFQAGEEAVTLDLLPLIETVAGEGRIEEEMYLTSFLWEEAKHVEFFRRWLDQVAEARWDLWGYVTPSYAHLFLDELPRAMAALRTDSSTEAQIRAATTYNMIIEGVLAETGYHGFRESLQANCMLPGLLEGITLIARDESRHIRYGVYLLNRLIAVTPGGWDVMNRRMNELLGPAMGVVSEFWDHFDPDDGPFGQNMQKFLDFASSLFDRRMKVLERDRGKALADIERATLADIVAEAEPVALTGV